jgi:thiol-disulfide isomerase/thioredoxin
MSQPGFSKSSEAERALLPREGGRWPVWPWLLLGGGLVVVMLIRAGITSRIEPRGERHPAVGSRLSMLHLEPLTGHGGPVELEDLKAKATLINFWGPWCGPCAVEFPHLVELEQHFRSESGFQFLSVSSNPNPFDEEGLAESTERFLKDHKADLPTFRDPQAATTKALIKDAKIENFGYPTTVLLGPGGVIRALWQGYGPGEETAMRLAIEKALAARK